MKTTLNLQDADTFYEQLMDAHTDLSREQSELFNARLILLLANQVGDAQVIWSVHGADGRQLALVADRKLAFHLAREHDFTPVSVH